MFFSLAVAVTLIILAYTLFVRRKDLPETPPVPPYQHLEMRKAAIYENLRDLIFEYRVGKLSDQDYDRTKKDLQAELGKVMAEIDSMKSAPTAAAVKPVKEAVSSADGRACPHCGAKFDKPLRFCGECGKPMGVTA
jgi:hypothetical protein